MPATAVLKKSPRKPAAKKAPLEKGIIEISRETFQKVTGFRPMDYFFLKESNYEKQRLAEVQARREKMPWIFRWLIRFPSKRKITYQFWDAFRGPAHQLTAKREEIEAAISRLQVCAANQRGKTLRVPETDFSLVEKVFKEMPDAPPETEAESGSWKEEASKHPDNGKTGWWEVQGRQHKAMSHGSSALEAIENAKHIVFPDWEEPQATFLGLNLPPTFALK